MAVASSARAWSEASFWTGSPSRRSSLISSSRPSSMASSRRSRENHWRILERARDEATMASQSRDGPAVGGLGGEDLHRVGRVEPGVERHQPPVDLGPDAPVADLGVDGVGEVHRRGVGGEGDDLALGGEDVDLVLLRGRASGPRGTRWDRSSRSGSRRSAASTRSRPWSTTSPWPGPAARPAGRARPARPAGRRSSTGLARLGLRLAVPRCPGPRGRGARPWTRSPPGPVSPDPGPSRRPGRAALSGLRRSRPGRRRLGFSL